jgi:nucleotide-binding universal stress UspA family protein
MAESGARTQVEAMYQTLLVPIDGSADSARALPVAAELARRTGAQLHLALVHDPSAFIPFVPGEVSVPVYDAEVEREFRQRDDRLLQEAVTQLAGTGVHAVGTLLEGTVVEALVEHARGIGADLVVMATHGRGGFSRLRLGSVAAAFLHHTPAPVLLVRSTDAAASGALPTGPLLVTLDGSPFAEAVLPHARALAEATGMRMALVGVVVPHAIPMAPFGAEALLADPSLLEAEEEGLGGYLRRVATHCPAGTTVHAVTDMAVARAIIDEAARQQAGALAIATHGRSGLKRLVLGSVADEVLTHATLPMLVVRPSA